MRERSRRGVPRRRRERRMVEQERGRDSACPERGVTNEPAQERADSSSRLRPSFRRAPARAATAPRRGRPPYAISFAIIGSYESPISSPSSTPASTRTPAGSTRRLMRPVCGRNVRGSSAYSRASIACPREWTSSSIVLAGRDAELQLDDVEARDRLGDRMLDLDPAVQLEEVDVGAVDEELGRAGALVADRLREGARSRRDRRPGARVEARSRATPRRASGGAAAPSSRGRRAP